jgi:hypothetical protein
MKQMKLQNAAALALVGWYLMVPPKFPDRLTVNFEAPISKWERYGTFETEANCQESVSHLHDQATKAPTTKKVNPTTPEQSMAAQYVSGECIASDDPLLKEK